MTKKIEIEIEDEIYERLKSECAKSNMDIRSYIQVVIEKYDHTNKQDINYIEEKVKKPLKKILNDLEGLNQDAYNNPPSTRVLLLPLKIYNNPLPQGFSRRIEYYKSKGWYDVEKFYLIVDGKNILGYLGLNISEEDAPYGRYLFIYGLNLYKEYQNSININYIVNFIKSIGRQGQCFSIDIFFENSNLTYDQLKELGFALFTSTDIVKIKVEEDSYDLNIDYLEIEDCNIEDIGKFQPVARMEPFKSLMSQWTAKKEVIEISKIICKEEKEEIEFIYIKENKSFSNTMYSCFTVLIKPQYLYEDDYISKIFSILKSSIFKNMDKDKVFAFHVPRDTNKNLLMYNEDDILDSLNWLRKNNS